MGGQAFADTIYTASNVEFYEGAFTGGEPYADNVTGSYVEVFYSSTPGRANRPSAIGGTAHGDYKEDVSICDNTVIMTGGSVRTLTGGERLGESDGNVEVSRNRVYITGGSAEYVYGGKTWERGQVDCCDNQIHLVGAGASVTVDGVTYEGHKMQLGAVVYGGTTLRGNKSGNSIDIYGSDITTAELMRGSFQSLNFHIADFDDGATMLTLSDAPLELTGFLIPTEETPTPELALTFDALDSLVWKSNATVTLVGAEKGINNLDPSLLEKECNIYRNGDPSQMVLDTATLELEQGEGTTQDLKLAMKNGNVPEPTSGTLGLLALCALCVRRRK